MALLAAALYGVSAPFAKLLLTEVPPAMMAAMLYLGAGIGMLIINIFKNARQHERREAPLTRQNLPSIIGMIALDIAAPLLLMMALTLTTATNASLLNNFEIVATAIIAMVFFKEAIGRRMWLAIALISLASFVLSVENVASFSFSIGSVFVVLACICWGLENNCTRKLSDKDPLQIVVIKGFGSGFGSLLVALLVSQLKFNFIYILFSLLLGFVAFGLSIYFYIKAQRELGAAQTSAYYAIAPFIGALVSYIIFGQALNLTFLIALVLMILGAALAAYDRHKHWHSHSGLTHNHSHRHDDHDHEHDHKGSRL